MNKVKLIITRKSSFVGMAVPVKIKINGMLIGQLKVNQKMELDVPPVPINLELDMVGNSMSIHPIKKTIVLNPAQSLRGVVTIDFGVKAKMLNIFTSGLWGKVGEFEETVKYL
ncbi:MAG: hypothetical protein NC328_03515 [Muribaculum sp.]|nr:hypothetical protein [Muribaculum sp.]